MLKIAEEVTDICVFSGNVLNMSEIKRKLGQSPTDEVLDTLRIILKEYTLQNQDDTLKIYSTVGLYPTVVEDPKELTTGVKLFISIFDVKELKEAVEKVLSYLSLEFIDSLILAHPGDDLTQLMRAWTEMESMVKSNKIRRIGVSDIDPDMFIELYNKAEVKPEIVQINLAICCVVPPRLQEFTKENEIQLLTHNDPKDHLLPKESLNEVFEEFLKDGREIMMSWAVRFLVHVKCRGVLTTKGYIVNLKVVKNQHLRN